MITTGNLENVDIRHDSDNRKYDAWDGGEVVGVVVYDDDLQTIGGPIRVTCPVVRAFIERNPRYARLLDRP